MLHIAYNGSEYRGWQRQINVVSVQQTFEECLSKVLNVETTVLGCGRTDALVHASQYFVQFKTDKALHEQFVFVMNKVLPASIRVYDLFEVNMAFNVQHQAITRNYRYYLHTKQNAFLGSQSAFYHIKKFNDEKANLALRSFVGYYDFYSYCKTPDRHVHTMVNISEVNFFKNEDAGIYAFEFTGDRFLKGMVRAMVYDIIEAAQGKLNVHEIQKKLAQQATYANIQLAYPQGLYLSKVSYSEIDVENRAEPISAYF